MSTQQASSELMRLINGYQVSQVIHVAASFGIADLLKDGPRLSAEIAEATGTHARSMHRLLRALASAGVVEEQPDSRFSLPISRNVCGRILRGMAAQKAADDIIAAATIQAWQPLGARLHPVLYFD